MVDMNRLIEYYLSNKGDLVRFLETDYEGKILSIFNEEGLGILKNFRHKEEIINYILAYSKYCKELFNNDEFLEFFFRTSLSSYYANLANLDETTLSRIISYGINNNVSEHNIAMIISYTKEEFQNKFLDRKGLSKGLLTELYKYCNSSVKNRILNEFNVTLDDLNIEPYLLFEQGKEEYYKHSEDGLYTPYNPITISSTLLSNEFLNRIWNEYNIYQVREIVDNATYVTDSSIIDGFVCKKEIESIGNINEYGLIEPFSKVYEYYLYVSSLDKESEEYFEQSFEYNKIISGLLRRIPGLSDINLVGRRSNNDTVFNELKKASDRLFSNYVIDYCFKDNYHNVIANLGELLNFYSKGHINLDDDRVYLYNRILNIDTLNIDEKLQLFNEIKDMNLVEILYDDLLCARRLRNESIKNYSLSNDKLTKLHNESLSNKYGVEVSLLNGQTFYGVVKSNEEKNIDDLPTGHSFSLVGPDTLDVFNSDGITYLYDTEEMNPDQIVHIFPFDSFTLYRPYKGLPKATDRVNKLLTAPELTNSTAGYNEMVILEQGKKEFPIDDKVPKLKKMAIYCVDEIRDFELEKAKETGLPIILVYSKAYEEQRNNKNTIDGYGNENLYLSSLNVSELEQKRL